MDFLAEWISESLEWIYDCLVIDPLGFWWELLEDTIRQFLLLTFTWLVSFLDDLETFKFVNDAALIVQDSMALIPFEVWHFAYKFGYYEMMISFAVTVPAIILFKFTMQMIRG